MLKKDLIEELEIKTKQIEKLETLVQNYKIVITDLNENTNDILIREANLVKEKKCLEQMVKELEKDNKMVNYQLNFCNSVDSENMILQNTIKGILSMINVCNTKTKGSDYA